jgi:hypothetical protein
MLELLRQKQRLRGEPLSEAEQQLLCCRHWQEVTSFKRVKSCNAGAAAPEAAAARWTTVGSWTTVALLQTLARSNLLQESEESISSCYLIQIFNFVKPIELFT